MSELHIEHPKSKRTKAAVRRKGHFTTVLKAFFIDMVPLILGILIALSLNGIKERNNPDYVANSDSAFIYFNNLFGNTSPNITNAAYLTLTSSGKLDIIANKEIVEGLVNLYTA